MKYKIRSVKKSSDPDVEDQYALTVPRELALKFLDVKFRIYVEHNSIVFESGCDIK